jgi:hypothetical protein
MTQSTRGFYSSLSSQGLCMVAHKSSFICNRYKADRATLRLVTRVLGLPNLHTFVS